MKIGHPQSIEQVVDSKTWVTVYNSSGEVIPAYACLRVTGMTTTDERLIVTVAKPSTTAQDFYLVNSAIPVPVGGYGEATAGPLVTVAYSGSPSYGTTVGPYNSWTVSSGYNGFVCIGIRYIANVNVIEAVQVTPGTAAEEIKVYGSAYDAGSETVDQIDNESVNLAFKTQELEKNCEWMTDHWEVPANYVMEIHSTMTIHNLTNVVFPGGGIWSGFEYNDLAKVVAYGGAAEFYFNINGADVHPKVEQVVYDEGAAHVSMSVLTEVYRPDLAVDKPNKIYVVADTTRFGSSVVVRYRNFWINRIDDIDDASPASSARVYYATAGEVSPGIEFHGNPNAGSGCLSRQAADFDDTSSQYLKRTVANFRSADSAGSVFGWIKPDVTASSFELFSTGDGGTPSYYVTFRMPADGSLRLAQSSNDTADVVDADVTGLDDGNWHFVGAGSNGTSYWIYADGTLYSTANSNLTLTGGSDSGDWFADTPSRTELLLGARTKATPDLHFGGAMDNWGVSPISLTKPQLDWMYTSVPDLTDIRAAGIELVNYWKLDERGGSTRCDAVGDDHLIPYGSGGPTEIDGKVETPCAVEQRGASFANASSQYYYAAKPTTSPDYEITMVTWVKSDDTGASKRVIMGMYDDTDSGPTGDDCYEVYKINTNAVRAQIDYGGGATSATSTKTIYDGKWHMIGTAVSSVTLKVYVDDEVTSVPNNRSWPAMNTIGIGVLKNASPTDFWDGDQGNAAAWDTSMLSDDNLIWLYNNGKGRTYEEIAASTDTDNPGDTNLIGFWKLSKNHTSRLDDAHTTALDLTASASAPTDTAGPPMGQCNRGTIYKLVDQSGNENHAVQATIADRPEYIELLSGVYGMYFAGSQYLQLSAFAIGDLAQPNDIYVLAKAEDTTPSGVQYIIDSADAAKRHMITLKATTGLRQIGADTLTDGTQTSGNLEVLAARFTTTDKLYVDGGTADISADVGSEAMAGLTIGSDNAGANGFEGYMGEIVVYSGALTTAEFNSLGNYALASRYSITWTDIT